MPDTIHLATLQRCRFLAYVSSHSSVHIKGVCSYQAHINLHLLRIWPYILNVIAEMAQAQGSSESDIPLYITEHWRLENRSSFVLAAGRKGGDMVCWVTGKREYFLSNHNQLLKKCVLASLASRGGILASYYTKALKMVGKIQIKTRKREIMMFPDG